MGEHRNGLPEMPAFEEFYDAVNGRRPFPWQARLARYVSEQGGWPAEVGVQTGLGKTTCLDIAVWWLASQAHKPPGERTAPTRIWWVVNRRLLVDEASRHAERLRQMLRHPRTSGLEIQAQDILERVAARLQSLTGSLGGEPLHVTPMRGGITLRRPPNPAQPSVLVSTIPMYGSRLLFRGFGSSRSMRPIDAAHAGTDSLVIVDEAHLARHLRELIPKLKCCAAATPDRLLPVERSAPQVVSLTATGDISPEQRFNLDEKDHEHEIVRQRLDAAKPLEIDAGSSGDSAGALRDAAVKILETAHSPGSCVIFCNTPDTARQVHSLIAAHKVGSAADMMLVTGRTRQHDADALRDRLLSRDGAPASIADLPERQRHLLVIATQTLEVGADLDFEYLVTEQCGVRALTQRLGRLNRLGRYPHARAVYVHRPPRRRRRSSSPPHDEDGNLGGGWPVYGTEPERLLARLESWGSEQVIDLSPRVIADRLGEPGEEPGRAPEVLPELLWEWVKTTTPPRGEAPVEPYFSGIQAPQSSVSVLWRVSVPDPARHKKRARDTTAAEFETMHEPDRLWPRVHSDESVEIPLHELRDALRARGHDDVCRRPSGGNSIEYAALQDLRPGDVVVLPADIGMHDEFGWAPDSATPVADVSIKRSGLPLEATALQRLCRDDPSDSDLATAVNAVLGDQDEEPDADKARDAADQLIAMLRERDAIGFEPDAWHDFLDSLDPNPQMHPNEVPRLATRTAPHTALVDESDELSVCPSLSPVAMELIEHGEAVGSRARETATVLGVSRALADVVGDSGRFHDVGKADRRFQRWLNDTAPNETQHGVPFDDTGPVLRAKSSMPMARWNAARRHAGWPRGGRHEELSARLVRAWLIDRDHALGPGEQDLLIHLVVSHHGRGRPLVVPVSDVPAEPVEWRFHDTAASVSVSADLSETDWEQPARFRRLNDRFGPWGLALLEAAVRQADHEVSAATEVQ